MGTTGVAHISVAILILPFKELIVALSQLPTSALESGRPNFFMSGYYS
jgi:hypothetical protein